MSQQFQPALVPLRGRRDHQFLELLCHSFLQPSFCIMLFAAACSAQHCVSTVFMAGVCMSFGLILTTTLRSPVVFCHGASFDIGASEAPLMPLPAADFSQSFCAFLQSLLNRLGPKSKRSPGTACFAQLLSADHFDHDFFASRWTPEARVGVASPATSGASSEAKHRRLQSTCGLPMQCLHPRIMLSTSLCSANMLVFLFSHMFLHTALMQNFSPNMSVWNRLPLATFDAPQELSLLICALALDLIGGRTALLLSLCAYSGVMCSIFSRQRQVTTIAEFFFTMAALACSSCRCCSFSCLQRAQLATCLCAPVFQIFALKRVEGLPGPPACRSVPTPWSLALSVLCIDKLGLAFRLAFDRLPGHFCGWCLIFMLLRIDCCLHWFTCASLLAAPASVRSNTGPPLGGCYFYTAARGLCAPLAQVSQSQVVSSSTYLHGVPWCSLLLPAPALAVCVVFVCCLRCLRWPFWAVQLRPSLPDWCMSLPRSLWMLCAVQRGWHALRRILGILLGVALAICLRDRPRKPRPLPKVQPRVQPVPQRTMTVMTRQAAPAQWLLRRPNPGRGPRRVPSNDAGPSAAPRSQLGHRPPSPPAPQAAATPPLPVIWSVLQVLSVGLRSFTRPRKTRAVPYRRRLRSSQRRGLLLIALLLSLRCVFDCASTGRLPASPRHGLCHAARDSAARCWSGQLCAARAISSSFAIVPRGHNRRHSTSSSRLGLAWLAM